jgi:ABC-2 type transport system permease protein
MNTRLEKLTTNLRIIWAIALKDLVDAIKNKTILSALGSVVFIIVMYKYMPYLEGRDELPNLLLYDAGESALAMELEDSPSLRLYTYDTRERMLDLLSRGDTPELGLVFPADLDQRIRDGEDIELDGYVAYWIQGQHVDELVAIAEEEIGYLAKRPVRIRVDDRRIYPQDPDEAGSGFLVSIAAVLVLAMTGVLVVVHLMLEEKQTKTIDALRVSPAGPIHMLLGKAVVGMVYCLIGVCAVYALNAEYITHWNLALLTALSGAVLTVGLGLLLGTLFDSRQQLVIWGFLIMNVLLVPAFLVDMSDLLPKTAIQLFRWVPTSAIAWLVRASFPASIPVGRTMRHLGLVLGSALIVYALAAWRMRELER